MSKKTKILIIVISLIFFVLVAYKNLKKEKESNQPLKKQKIKTVEKLNLPKLTKKSGRVKIGENITAILTRNGLTRAEAYTMIQEVKKTYNLAKIRAGNKFKILKANDEFTKFVYYIDINKYLEVKRKENNFSSKIITIPYTTKKSIIKVKIESSLFEAILKENEKPELADILASLYDYDVDFNRDLRKGDVLIAIIEKKFLKGKFVKYGNIIASSFINNGSRIDIIRYRRKNGEYGYFHPDGSAVKKMFLKSPLPFMKITSRFGWRRHPILGFSARHNGVDLGAPVGTKVRATASGTIIARGYDRVRGRYIIIRHPNGYRTHYYHLSRYASGIRRGKKVSQGQIIAYVGNTGRSTGPHLHYGVQKYGRYINPLTLKSPSLKPLSKLEIPAFKRYSRKIIRLFNEIIVFNMTQREINKEISNKLNTISPHFL